MPPTAIQATVEQIENLSYNVRSFRLKLKEPQRMEFQAGQFMIVDIPHQGKTVKRAYSISSAPHEKGALEFCIQHLEGGIASTFFWKLKAGDALSLAGPHGRFFLKDPVDYEPVFVATGTGVAPLRSMIKDLIHRGVTRNIWLLFGCRYEHAVLYESEFRSLASARRNFNYHITVSRPKEWTGNTGYVQQLFQKLITDYSNKEVYLCGFQDIIKKVIEDLKAQGVPKEKLNYEEWG